MANTTKQMSLPRNMHHQNRKVIFRWGILITALLLIIGFGVANYSVRVFKSELIQTSETDAENITYSRAKQINNWLGSLLEETARFRNSPLVRNFADQVDDMGDNILVTLNNSSDIESINLEYMQQTLVDFVHTSFNFGAIMNKRGEVYLSTDFAQSTLDSRQLTLVKEVIKTGNSLFGPVSYNPKYGLYISIYQPINTMKNEGSGKQRTIAVLMLTKSIGPKLNELLAPSGYLPKNFNSYLLQTDEGEIQNISFTTDKVLPVRGLELDNDKKFQFELRNSITGNQKVYSIGAKVELLNWWIYSEKSYDVVAAKLQSKRKEIYTIAALSSLALLLLMSAIWWWLVGFQRSRVLQQFQNLFKVIDEQKRLLDSINSTISDPISLTDTKGIYLYVNQAFADAVGRKADDIPNLDTAAVFGFDTAKRLNVTDQHVLMAGEEITVHEVIWLQSKKHCFQISKSPLRDPENNKITGIVSVYRDVTQIEEAEEHGRRVVQQTIDALVQAIEKADPFLGGHSRIMSEVATLICKALNLPEKETATIETAAALSQIGKMFVPREVLTKPGTLTEQEKKLMEQHVEYTKNILKDIEFDLPVLEAIYQMNERLDGKGYPAGLLGDQINIYAKILAVANAFTAMARPRAYRSAMSVEMVLDTLESNNDAYDKDIVKILRETLNTPLGKQVALMATSSRAI